MARKKKLPAGMRYRPNGKIEYRFRFNDRQYSVTGDTQEDCIARKIQKIEEEERGTYKKSRTLTMSEYMDRWLKSRTGLKPASVLIYTKFTNRMNRQTIDNAGHVFGGIKLCDLETENIRQLQKSLQRDGLHTRTINDSISLLKHALEDAHDEEIIKRNPAKRVKPLPPTEEPARDTIHRALTREEVDAFLKAARDSWYYPLYVFLLNTGLRIGEASALTVRDVTEQSINVCKTVTRTQAGYTIAEQTKTTAGKRTIATRPEAWKAFQDQRRYNDILNKTKVVKLSDPVFTLPRGNIIRPDSVNSDIKRICEKTGIAYFSCHAFRATFTSRCVSAGVPVKVLMETLGHTDVQMTLGLYAHAEAEQKRDEILSVSV